GSPKQVRPARRDPSPAGQARARALLHRGRLAAPRSLPLRVADGSRWLVRLSQRVHPCSCFVLLIPEPGQRVKFEKIVLIFQYLELPSACKTDPTSWLLLGANGLTRGRRQSLAHAGSTQHQDRQK